MLRAGSQTALRLQGRANIRIVKESRRKLSSTSSGGSSLKTVGLASGVVLAGFGGTVAYAKYDPDFRSSVQRSIPAFQSVFDTILGPASKNEVTKPSRKPTSKRTHKVDPFEKPFGSKRKDEEMPVVDGRNVKVGHDMEDLPGISSVLDKQETLALDTPSAATETKITDIKVDSKTDKEATDKVVESDASAASDEFVGDVETNKAEEESAILKLPPLLEFSPPESTTTDIIPPTPSSELPPTFNEPINTRKEKKANVAQKTETNLDVAASTSILGDLLGDCSVACANAILSNNNAANAVAHHSSLLRTALDDMQASAEEKSLQWTDVSIALIKKKKNLEIANTSYQQAIEQLAKMKQVLDQVKAENPQIKKASIEVEKSCMDMSKDLEMAKSKIRRFETEAQMLSKYQQLIEDSTSSIRRELSLPEGKVEESWRRESVRLSQDEEMEIIRHMQRQLEQLRSELSDKQTNAAERLEEMMASIRDETEQQVRHRAEVDLLRNLEENKLQYEQKLAEAIKAHNVELSTRLQRQTAEHAEHLTRALAYMDKQAAAKYEENLKTEVGKLRRHYQAAMEKQKEEFEDKTLSMQDQYLFDLSIAHAKVAGIEKAIDGRAHIEKQTRKAEELSLACDSLRVSMKFGDGGRPQPLATEVETVKQVYSDNDVINEISAAFPKEAVHRGVYTEEIIRMSFQKIGKLCRRLSMVDESHNSLFIYFLSFLKSLLTISSASTAPPIDVDQSNLDVFSIISYANYCVEHGNVEQAVRFVNQLEGESRRAAEDWLKEARLYLETKQTVDALCAVANAILIGARLEK